MHKLYIVYLQNMAEAGPLTCISTASTLDQAIYISCLLTSLPSPGFVPLQSSHSGQVSLPEFISNRGTPQLKLSPGNE